MGVSFVAIRSVLLMDVTVLLLVDLIPTLWDTDTGWDMSYNRLTISKPRLINVLGAEGAKVSAIYCPGGSCDEGRP